MAARSSKSPRRRPDHSLQLLHSRQLQRRLESSGTPGASYGWQFLRDNNRGRIYDDYGTVFKITPAGALTTLHSFSGSQTDGGYPDDSLLQATDGNFYGTTGGTACYAGNCGTVFLLNVGLNPFVETQPTSGMVGTPVTVLGTNLTGATSVTFNGTGATFNVVSPTEITTNVPSGATTGLVQVTVPSGTLSSNATFQITSPVQFVPIPPCRLVDTRTGGGPIQGGTYQTFNLPQLAQQKGCADLSTAAAYSLNLAVVPAGAAGLSDDLACGRDSATGLHA